MLVLVLLIYTNFSNSSERIIQSSLNRIYYQSTKTSDISNNSSSNSLVWNVRIAGLEYLTGSLAGFFWSKVFFPASKLKHWYYIPKVAGGYSLFVGPTAWLTGELMGDDRSLPKAMIGAFAGGAVASLFIPHEEGEYSFKDYWYYETLPAVGAMLMDGTINWGNNGRFGYEFVIGGGASFLLDMSTLSFVYREGSAPDNPFLLGLVEIGRSTIASIPVGFIVYKVGNFNGEKGNLKKAILGAVVGGVCRSVFNLIGYQKDWDLIYLWYSYSIILPTIGAIIGNEL